jgi:hypothetical protein
MDAPLFSAANPRDTPITIIMWIFRAIFGAAVLLALMILILPDQLFLAVSNYIQIIAAIAGALVFLYLWHRYGRKDFLLYAAGAFGFWGIENILWYVNILLGQRNILFPSMIDLGMIASIVILTAAFWIGFSKKTSPNIPLLVIVLSLLIPLWIIITQGAGAASLVTLLYFCACGSLVAVGLFRSIQDSPLVLAGILLFALAFMIYPLREQFFTTMPVLNAIGTFVSAGFALIVLGVLPAGTPAGSS